MRKCPYCDGKVIIDKSKNGDGKCNWDVIKVKCTVCGLSSKEYTEWY